MVSRDQDRLRQCGSPFTEAQVSEPRAVVHFTGTRIDRACQCQTIPEGATPAEF